MLNWNLEVSSFEFFLKNLFCLFELYLHFGPRAQSHLCPNTWLIFGRSSRVLEKKV